MVTRSSYGSQTTLLFFNSAKLLIKAPIIFCAAKELLPLQVGKKIILKDFFYFVKGNFRTVSFGWLLTFLSGFGQTFLISLYVPEILEAFSISEGTFGSIYAGCTVTASLIMLSVGHTVDHKPAKLITALTVLGLGLSSILLGFSTNLLLLIIAITGLRLTGQGLLTHISMTIMSKQFVHDRGKALSFSSLGFSMSEALFPLLVSFVIAWFDWRIAAMASGAALLLYLVRLKFTDLQTFDAQLSSENKPSAWSLLKDYKSVVFDKKFGIMMPASFIWSFSATAIFFYQYVFVENKGWSVHLYATFFTVYAATRFVFSLFGGMWVDKYTAKRLFRYYLVPATLGLLPFAFMNSIIRSACLPRDCRDHHGCFGYSQNCFDRRALRNRKNGGDKKYFYHVFGYKYRPWSVGGGLANGCRNFL